MLAQLTGIYGTPGQPISYSFPDQPMKLTHDFACSGTITPPHGDSSTSAGTDSADSSCGDPPASVVLQNSRRHQPPGACKEPLGTADWWKTLSTVCPLSGVPIAMLPYPPFKLKKVRVGQKEYPATHIDGRFLALQLICDFNFHVLGRDLTKNDVDALDAYLKKCKFNMRVSKAIALTTAGTEDAAALKAVRARASRDLESLKCIQEARMRNSHKILKQPPTEPAAQDNAPAWGEQAAQEKGGQPAGAKGRRQARKKGQAPEARTDVPQCHRCQAPLLTSAGLRATLEAACKRSGACYAIFWASDGGDTLSVKAHYNTPEFLDLQRMQNGDENDFCSNVYSLTLGTSQGLPGRVFQSSGKELIPDVGAMPADGFLHSKLAMHFGIRSIAAVSYEGGVLECGTTQMWTAFPKVTITSQLAEFGGGRSPAIRPPPGLLPPERAL